MGDRANVVNTYGKNNERVYLYSHWGGDDLPATLQKALQRGRPRWGDGSYLTRIIFCEMIKDSVLDETGFGISPFITDNEHDLLHVDHELQTVSIVKEKDNETLKTKGRFTFKEYCELTPADLTCLAEGKDFPKVE